MSSSPRAHHGACTRLYLFVLPAPRVGGNTPEGALKTVKIPSKLTRSCKTPRVMVLRPGFEPGSPAREAGPTCQTVTRKPHGAGNVRANGRVFVNTKARARERPHLRGARAVEPFVSIPEGPPSPGGGMLHASARGSFTRTRKIPGARRARTSSIRRPTAAQSDYPASTLHLSVGGSIAL